MDAIRFLPVIRAHAVRAAHGDLELFQDAMQDGLEIAHRAIKAADPLLGDPAQYVCLRLTAMRGDSRKQLTAPIDSFSDLLPQESDEDIEFEGEPMGLGPDVEESTGWAFSGPITRDLVERLVAWTMEMLETIAWDSANPTIVDLSPNRRRTSDIQALETYWDWRANTQMLADEPVWFPQSPPPFEQLGEPYTQFSDEIDELEDSRPERTNSWKDEYGNAPDASLELDLSDQDESEWLPEKAKPVSLPDDPLDSPPAIKMEIPSQFDVEIGLQLFFGTLPKPEKYSRASREAFIRAMIAGNGMKAANRIAWAVAKRTFVAATPKGLRTSTGAIIPFSRAAREPKKWVLDADKEYVCAKLAHLPAAKAYVQALEASS